MANHLRDSGVQVAKVCGTWLPIPSTAQLVEGPYDLQKRLGSTLPDPIVIMRQLGDQFQSTLLDIGKEVFTGRNGKVAKSLRCNFLLDAYGGIDVEDFVEIDSIVSVDITVEPVDVDGCCGRRTRGEIDSRFRGRRCSNNREKARQHRHNTAYLKEDFLLRAPVVASS